jgi:hypothetical protein
VGTAAVDQFDGGPGEIDEQLLAGTVDLAHGALELPGKAPVILAELGIGVGVAIRWCDSLASSFKRNTSFILRILILGTGTLSPDKRLEAYPFGCYMRNIISARYDAIPVA